MRKLGKYLGRVVAFLLLAACALWLIGPYEPADLKSDFDASALDGGIAAHFARVEAKVPGITPGVQKQVIWAGAPEVQTDWAVLYVHGFSATLEEIRPVPDQVARALGANLVYTRLAGHGQDGAAMGRATVADWMQDTAEALAAARKAGRRVLVMSTSTGGTLSAAAAVDPALSQDVAGMVMVSPNFAINNDFAFMLTWPAARYWMPLVVGAERSFEPASDAVARYWTHSYPSTATLPLAALVKQVQSLDFSRAGMPALFFFSDKDQVVVPEVTRRIAGEWGGPVTIINPDLGEGDDPSAHVIAGDIVSPGQTDALVQAILGWAAEL